MVKVQSQDIDNKAFLTTGTAPDYEITIPREASYADMDRQKITVNLHASASAAITFNVNGLGAKALVDNTGTAITSANGDDYMDLIYDVSQDNFIGSFVGLSTLGSNLGIAGLSNFNQAINTATGDITYPHSLGNIPSEIILTMEVGGSNGGHSRGVWNASNQYHIFHSYGISTAMGVSSGSVVSGVDGTSKTGEIIAVTAIDFTIRRTGANSDANNMYVMVEAR